MNKYNYNKNMKISDVVRGRLVELREERSWTQKEVAQKLNISQRAYSHYENGSRNLSLEMLADIADIYGVSIAFLISSENEMRGG